MNWLHQWNTKVPRRALVLFFIAMFIGLITWAQAYEYKVYVALVVGTLFGAGAVQFERWFYGDRK